MKRLLIILILQLPVLAAFSQTEKMTNEKLSEIFQSITEQIEGQNGNWQFIIDSTLFICLTDETHNRMRIISPVEELAKISKDQMLKCMEANFHTVLDSKYAVSDDILWSVFIHPLGELTEEQVISAIVQVYSGVKTYGTVYSSGLLSFPKAEEVKKPKKEKKL